MEQITVTVLGKDISLVCKPDEKSKLIAAVKQADEVMQKIKMASGNLTTEKVALLASIQLSLQLLTLKSDDGPFQGVAYGDYKSKMEGINSLLDKGIRQLS